MLAIVRWIRYLIQKMLPNVRCIRVLIQCIKLLIQNMLTIVRCIKRLIQKMLASVRCIKLLIQCIKVVIHRMMTIVGCIKPLIQRILATIHRAIAIGHRAIATVRRAATGFCRELAAKRKRDGHSRLFLVNSTLKTAALEVVSTTVHAGYSPFPCEHYQIKVAAYIKFDSTLSRYGLTSSEN